MKLLIVDDEALTREGLISSIDWNSLGIYEIFEANDGLNGLAIAKQEKPEIILCDIRMPRMTGIELIEKLEHILPDTSVIFMSGYSDKEYLKAAIKFKAVNYVEKPLNPSDIKDAIIEAKSRVQEKSRSRETENFYSVSAKLQLGGFLTKPFYKNQKTIESLLEELGLGTTTTSFSTFIVKTIPTDFDSSIIEDIQLRLESLLTHYHLYSLYSNHHLSNHIFFIVGDASKKILTEIGNYISLLFSPIKNYQISQGKSYSGDFSAAYDSYASAASLLSSAYFYPLGSVIFEHIDFGNTPPLDEDPIVESLKTFLLTKNAVQCSNLLSSIYNIFNETKDFSPSQAKNLYYRLFVCLDICSKELKLLSSEMNDDESTVLEYLEKSFIYDDLHILLDKKINIFFKAIDSYVPEDSTIFLIKDYISKNYANDMLSIKDISDHVNLSVSYICTYFKNQTGQTLNQYLTDYRMEKAKLLLLDARNQITDISSKVGYSNGNYFGKSFKKSTGLSPSKYRENNLK